jgi:hypothetical protein
MVERSDDSIVKRGTAAAVDKTWDELAAIIDDKTARLTSFLMEESGLPKGA